jgi:hypothetical protein
MWFQQLPGAFRAGGLVIPSYSTRYHERPLRSASGSAKRAFSSLAEHDRLARGVMDETPLSYEHAHCRWTGKSQTDEDVQMVSKA